MHHLWTKDMTDVILLGFLMNADPVNHPKDFIEDKSNPTFRNRPPVLSPSRPPPQGGNVLSLQHPQQQLTWNLNRIL
jgi:hypothetical protein